VRDDGLALTDPYPLGVTTVTWSACDATCNCSTCVQHVIVRARGVFDPPNRSEAILGHWSPSGFTLRYGSVLPIPFHLEDCKRRIICCDTAQVVLKIRGPNAAGKMITRKYSLANGKLRMIPCPCCYEAVFNTRTESVRRGGRYTADIVVNGARVGRIRFMVF
jgi:hypothetical protein